MKFIKVHNGHYIRAAAITEVVVTDVYVHLRVAGNPEPQHYYRHEDEAGAEKVAAALVKELGES